MHWKQKLRREIRSLELKAKDSTTQTKSKIERQIAHMRRRMVQNPNGHNQQTKKTHCPHGHKYTKQNTLVQGDGSRVCRTCRRERRAARSKVRTRQRNGKKVAA